MEFILQFGKYVRGKSIQGRKLFKGGYYEVTLETAFDQKSN